MRQGGMHNRQAVNLSMFWRCLKDRDMWPIYWIGFSWMLCYIPATQYITIILKSDGFSTFETNLLTIPAYVMFILNLLFWTYVSEKFNERLLLCLATQIWCFPLILALELLPAGQSGSVRWGRYACTTLVVGSPYVHAILVALTSRNAGSVRTRTVASALYNMAVQVSNIIGINVRKDPALDSVLRLTRARSIETTTSLCTGRRIRLS